jgi:GTP-binding protein
MNDDGTAVRKLLKSARFLLSTPELRDLPRDQGCEVAFAGRSNTGKSSAINVLCNQRSLARTSRTPGRTQHFVVFTLDDERRLVDLPGFGYAKVAKTVRAHWDRVLPQYLERRRSLAGFVLLMDIRHPVKPQDEILIAWCAAAGVPLHILLNKADKLSRGAALEAQRVVARHLSSHGGPASSVQLFSALKQHGLDEAYGVLADWLQEPARAD